MVDGGIVGQRHFYCPSLAFAFGAVKLDSELPFSARSTVPSMPFLTPGARSSRRTQPVAWRGRFIDFARLVLNFLRPPPRAPPRCPDDLVQRLDVRPSVRQHQARSFRTRIPVGQHLAHDRCPRAFPRFLQPDISWRCICRRRLGRAELPEVPGGCPLPFLALPARALQRGKAYGKQPAKSS